MNKQFTPIPAAAIKPVYSNVKILVIKLCLLFALLFLMSTRGNATAWTTAVAGDITNLANWTDGTSAPTTFTTPLDTWTVTLSMTLNPASLSIPWTIGTAMAKPVTVTFAPGGTLTVSGSSSKLPIYIYGNLVMSGGTLHVTAAAGIVDVYGDINMTAGIIRSAGSGSALYLTDNGNSTYSGGTVSTTGSSATIDMNTTGSFNVSGGTISSAASSSNLNSTVNGNFTMTSGTVSSVSSSSTLAFTVNGNTTISGGTFSTTGASSAATLNTHGNFSMSGGTVSAGGASGTLYNNIFGNGSFISAASVVNVGAGCTSEIHFGLTSGTMLIDNTSTGTWSGTDVFVDAGCTAQLGGNFSTTTGTSAFGLTVNGTLVCPAAFTVNGTRKFVLSSLATLKVAATTGINGAIVTTGTRTFSTTANYVFNGTAAQVTGTDLPTALVSPSTLTISNSAGVTLSQNTATTGILAFTSGILNTSTYTMTTPGAATAVTGAGAASYVNGTLVKTISGLTAINYETGDLSYAPMAFTLSPAGTGGSLGVKVFNGLHPSIATSGLSSANIANHYWTVTNTGAAGPTTIIPKATYNVADILGGSNSAFATQHYAASAWLGTALVSTNTTSPYTSAPTAGVALASFAGDYVYGNVFCGTLPITGTTVFCAKATTSLSDATTGGTWTSSNTSIATVSSTGVVTGVIAGTAIISYTKSGCSATTTVTVNPCTTLSAGQVNKPATTELKVFPNPNTGTFTMNLLCGSDETVHVVITNIVGAKVKEFTTVTNKEMELSLDAAPGLYLLSAATAQERYMAKVVIE